MRLEDIKAKIDSYFENISEQELFVLLTEKYHMPVVYDIDLAPIGSDITHVEALAGIDDIEYKLVPPGDLSIDEVAKVNSSDKSCTLSFAA